MVLQGLSPEGGLLARDRINRKPSEGEAFAGTVLRLAKSCGSFAAEKAFLYEEADRIEK